MEKKSKSAAKIERSLEEDVSKELFALCEEIPIGKLVASEEFKLGEAMSSVELMDPKMDSGMRRINRKMGLAAAIEKGLYKEDDLSDTVATIDATFAMLVAWLEGNNLAQTLWTNVMFSEVDLIEHEVYSPLCHSFIHLVQIFIYVIQNACTYEEEDFNPNAPFNIRASMPRDRVIRTLRQETARLAERAQRMSTSTDVEVQRKSKKVLAIGARLEMCCLFIELFCWLIPPGRNQFETRQRLVEDEATDEDDEVEGSGRRGNAEEEEEEEEEEEDQPAFRPNFTAAISTARRLENVVCAVLESHDMATPAPEGGDADFSWLPAFDPDLNRHLLPSTFPRKVNIPDRVTALEYMLRLTKKLYIIASNAPSSTYDLTGLFYFARSYNIDKSCVLSRAVLQLVVFPVDEHICGDPERTIAEPITTTLRSMYSPVVLMRGTPVNKDHGARELFEIFVSGMSRVVLNVYQLFGCNMARQRDRLESAIEELANLQIDATRLEIHTEDVMRRAKNDEIKMPHPSFSTFIFNNLLALISHYMELSFRMDLFVPYEFTYIYWYFGTIVARWQISSMERCKELMKVGFTYSIENNTSKSRRAKAQRMQEAEAYEKRGRLNTYQMAYQYSLCRMSEGIVSLTMAMVKLGKLKVPVWSGEMEEIRYEMRMAPFKCLGTPLYVGYREYKRLSAIDKLSELPAEKLIDQGMEFLELARKSLEKLVEKPEIRDDSAIYLKVCKANFIAARLMKMQNLSNRRVEWFYTEECAIFPQIRII